MCGLFAVLSKRGPIREDYARSLDLIAHRGPDGVGEASVDLATGPEGDRASRAWLGHRRLSIIDPDPRANQPMVAANGRYIMVYNGEIYNYLELRRECLAAGWSFSTESDSEVLMACWALWGTQCLPRLVGMFALVIIDRAAATAWIARDGFGIKPLHVAVVGDRVLISSEIPALLATGRIPFEIDPRVATEFVRFGASVDLEQTPIRGIRRLRPASWASFDFSTGELSPPVSFWTPTRDQRRPSFADAVAECRERFLTNIRLHLRSDVPVGAALSGGLDSSAIVAAIHHLEPDLPINTFSFISSEPGQSEERWVDIVNAHSGGIAHKIFPDANDLGKDLDALVMAQGEPFASASAYAQFRVFRAAREADIPVTLDGQGADELLAGYWPYLGTYGAAALRSGRIDRAISLARGGGASLATSLRLIAHMGQSLMPASAVAAYRRVLGRRVLPDIFNRSLLASEGVEEREMAAEAIGSYRSMRDHLVDTAVRTSLPTLLRLADRSSMAFSVESRVPFLTPDFADFLFSLPPDYLVSRNGERKHVFREAMRGILPEAIRTRRDKIGFFADDDLWLRRHRAQVEPALGELRAHAMFDFPVLQRTVAAYFDRGEGSPQQIWRVAMFAMWSARMRTLTA